MKLLFILALFIISNFTLGQEYFEIQFEVYNYLTDEKLDNNKVILKNEKGKTILDTTVNNTFKYKFKVIKKGFYTVELTNDENYLKHESSLVTFGKYRNTFHFIKLYYSDVFYQNKILEYNDLNLQEDSIYGKKSSVPQYSTGNYFEPEYKGGISELMKYISNNIIYPFQSIELGDQGKVYLEFIVETDGEISHVTVIKGVSAPIDAEAIRVIRSLKYDKPAYNNAGPVRCICRIPLNFTLD